MGGFIDLKNKKFGKLTVIELDQNKSTNRRKFWLCNCDCGSTNISKRQDYFTRTPIPNCGCEKRKKIKYTKSKDNMYYIATFDDDSTFFLFDASDYEYISKQHWYFKSNGYVCNTKGEYIHRLLVGVTEFGEYVDHINGDKFDNRRCNLRVCSNAENARNSSIGKNNTSGVRGVWFSEQNNKWIASIKVDYEFKYLGSFDEFNSAIKAREEAEEIYFGEFSYKNSQNINPKQYCY